MRPVTLLRCPLQIHFSKIKYLNNVLFQQKMKKYIIKKILMDRYKQKTGIRIFKI